MGAPTAAQETLIAAISEWLAGEPLFEAAWLAGSLGAGEGDAYSDVDVLALAVDGQVAQASASVERGLTAFADPVLINRLFGGRVISVVGADWSRFDITIVQGAELERYDARRLTPMFNRGRRQPPLREARPYRTTPQVLLPIVQEFMRILGLLPLAIGREEYILSFSGVEHLRRLTLDLMLEANGVSPARRGGALRRNPFLTEAQRAAMMALPPLLPSRESGIESNLAIARIFLPLARALATEIGMAWPDRLETAMRNHLRARLGLEV
jgi:hypothetical protein